MSHVSTALVEFLETLYREGANITEIAKAIKEIDHKLHTYLQKEALRKEDPEIISYLKQEAPFYYSNYKFSKEFRKFLLQ